MLKQKRSPRLINVGLQQLYLGVSGYFVGALPSHGALPSAAGAGKSSPRKWEGLFFAQAPTD